jgi:phosphoserine phosphatase
MSESLSLWPEGFEDILSRRLQAFKDEFGKARALFDADETLWHGDIVEAHYALMEVVRRHDAFNFQGHPTVEHHQDESMVAYYQRLYDAQGVHVAFEWACDVYGGHKSTDIIREAELLFDQTRSDLNDLSYPRPKFYQAQRQLLEWLRANDVEAWVISASPEVLIHAALIALKLTDLIPLHRALGVNYALSEDGTSIDTLELRRQYEDASETLGSLLHNPNVIVTDQRCGPLTWQEGKVEGFRLFHSEDDRPFLVAGDSPNDFAMQFLTPHHCGLRVRIAKDSAHEAKRREATEDRANREGWTHSVEEDLSGWIDIDPAPWRAQQ